MLRLGFIDEAALTGDAKILQPPPWRKGATVAETKIEWTERTWNPLRGCSRISEGCRNCYAERMAARFSKLGEPFANVIDGGKWNRRVELVESKLSEPLSWRKPSWVFVNSMSENSRLTH